jgi:hypothetical protein
MSELNISKLLKLMGLALLCVCILPLSAFAGAFDGSKPLYCSLADAIECVPGVECQEVMPESVNLPNFLKIDFKKKRITATKEGGVQRTSKIENRERIDGKLIMQGAEDGVAGVRDGLGWSIAISESTGKMVLTGSGDQFGLVVFGACIPQ